MKSLVVAAFAFATLVMSPAMAANHEHGGRHFAGARMGGGAHGGGHVGGVHFARPMRHGGSNLTMHRTRPMHYRIHGAHYRATRRAIRHAARHTIRRAVHHAMRHATHHAVAPNRDRFSHMRRAVHAARRFHGGAYRRPAGWYAHHWVIGERLPRAWFVRDYWITDWAIYGLWAPIDGLIWVRVGPDAMLIDPITGAIVAVDYGLFW